MYFCSCVLILQFYTYRLHQETLRTVDLSADLHQTRGVWTQQSGKNRIHQLLLLAIKPICTDLHVDSKSEITCLARIECRKFVTTLQAKVSCSMTSTSRRTSGRFTKRAPTTTSRGSDQRYVTSNCIFERGRRWHCWGWHVTHYRIEKKNQRLTFS